jgi:hypothetical protein
MVGHRRLGIMAGPLLLVATSQRLFGMAHFVFKPDYGYELPRGSLLAITRLTLPTTTFYRLRYRCASREESLDIADVQARGAGTWNMGPSLRLDHLFQVLKDGWDSDWPTYSL